MYLANCNFSRGFSTRHLTSLIHFIAGPSKNCCSNMGVNFGLGLSPQVICVHCSWHHRPPRRCSETYSPRRFGFIGRMDFTAKSSKIPMNTFSDTRISAPQNGRSRKKKRKQRVIETKNAICSGLHTVDLQPT